MSLAALAALALQERRVLAAFGGAGTAPAWTILSVPCLVVGVSLLPGPRWRWRALALLGAAWSFVLLADRAYAEYFHQPVNLQMTSGLSQLWDVRASILALLQPYDLVLMAAWVALAVLAWRRGARLMPGLPGRTGRLAGLALALLGAGGLWHAGERASALEIPAVGGSVGAYAREFGLGWYHLRDLWMRLHRDALDQPLAPAQRDRILAALLHKQQLNATTSPLFGALAGRNVVLIQLEAFSRALLDANLADGPLTPTLDDLAASGLSFDFAMDTAGVGRTSDSEFQALTGLRSHSSRPVAFTHTRFRYTTLASVLAAHGAATLSFHGNRGGFWNRSVTHPNYGIERSDFEETFARTVPRAWGVSDADVLAQVPGRLAALDSRFLALIITVSSHHPFHDVPDAVAELPVPAEDGSMLAGYLRLARFTDTALADFMTRMEQAGLAQHTLFVLYGDHDPGLDADGRRVLGALTGRDLDHPEQRRVPLVFLAPGAEDALAAGRAAAAHTIATFPDIAPTVLHLLGEPIPLGMYGTHLFVPADQRDPVALGEQQGFALGDTIHTLRDDLHDATPEELAALDAAARAAQRERALIDAILDHGGQALAAQFEASHRPGDAERQRLLALADDAEVVALPKGTPRRWTRESRDAETALPGGAQLVPLWTPNTAFVRTGLRLANPGAQSVEARVSAHDATGRLLWQQTVELPAGQNLSLDPAAHAEGWPAYLLVAGPPGLEASSVARHSLGVLVQPSVSGAAPEVVLGGTIRAAERSYVLLVNLADTPRTAQLDVRAGEQSVLSEAIELPPGERVLRHVWLPARGSGRVEIRVAGRDVVVDAIHWREDAGD